MENSNQLSTRFKEVLLDGTWIANTNFRDQLTSINWKQASRQIGTLNTIGALTNHINYYIKGILNVFEGGTLDIRDKFSFDFPPVRSQKEWEQILIEIFSNAEKFASHIEQMSDEKLESNFVKKEYGNYQRNIEGMIEHCYYHLGQISLLKKMILELEKSN